jgi:hypothetical protein
LRYTSLKVARLRFTRSNRASARSCSRNSVTRSRSTPACARSVVRRP